MTSFNIESKQAYTTDQWTATNENAPAATEALKPNKLLETKAWEDDLRSKFKHMLQAINDAEISKADDFENLVAFSIDTTANDLILEDRQDSLVELTASPVESTPRYKLLTDDDLNLFPPVEWCVKDVLPSQGLAVVFGPSGSGKSLLVLDLLQSLAFGSEWFGRRVNPCSVTYVSLEGEAGLAGRVKAYRIHHGATSPNIRYLVQPFSLLKADDINDLALAIQAAGTGDVVVLDTLSRATSGSDENDSKAMGQIVAYAKMLQDLTGGLVLFVHHTGKDASKGMRGHSSLHAAVDCAIEVKRSGDRREWVLAKSKDGEDGASHPFKLEVVPMGDDNDGDAITSCVIVPNQSAQSITKKMASLGSNQTLALTALEEPMDKSLEVDKDGAPRGRPCLRFEQALAIVTPLMPVGEKYKKQRAKETLASLVKKDLVGMTGDWLWIN